MLMSISIVLYFLLVGNIQLHNCTTICLLIHLLMDIYIAAWILIQPIYFTPGGTEGKGRKSSQRGFGQSHSAYGQW